MDDKEILCWHLKTFADAICTLQSQYIALHWETLITYCAYCVHIKKCCLHGEEESKAGARLQNYFLPPLMVLTLEGSSDSTLWHNNTFELIPHIPQPNVSDTPKYPPNSSTKVWHQHFLTVSRKWALTVFFKEMEGEAQLPVSEKSLLFLWLAASAGS